MARFANTEPNSPATEDWDLVFCTRRARPLHGPTVTRQFQAVLEEAGLPRQRFHDLRHARASLLLAQEVPMRVVMETLGHSQIGVTANTCSHGMGELQREAAARMDSILHGEGRTSLEAVATPEPQ